MRLAVCQILVIDSNRESNVRRIEYALDRAEAQRAAELKCPMAGVDRVGQMSHGPWQGRTYGGSSFAADAPGKILLTLCDRDTDLRVIDLPVGSQNN